MAVHLTVADVDLDQLRAYLQRRALESKRGNSAESFEGREVQPDTYQYKYEKPAERSVEELQEDERFAEDEEKRYLEEQREMLDNEFARGLDDQPSVEEQEGYPEEDVQNYNVNDASEPAAIQEKMEEREQLSPKEFDEREAQPYLAEPRQDQSAFQESQELDEREFVGGPQEFDERDSVAESQEYEEAAAQQERSMEDAERSALEAEIAKQQLAMEQEESEEQALAANELKGVDDMLQQDEEEALGQRSADDKSAKKDDKSNKRKKYRNKWAEFYNKKVVSVDKYERSNPDMDFKKFGLVFKVEDGRRYFIRKKITGSSWDRRRHVQIVRVELLSDSWKKTDTKEIKSSTVGNFVRTCWRARSAYEAIALMWKLE